MSSIPQTGPQIGRRLKFSKNIRARPSKKLFLKGFLWKRVAILMSNRQEFGLVSAELWGIHGTPIRREVLFSNGTVIDVIVLF